MREPVGLPVTLHSPALSSASLSLRVLTRNLLLGGADLRLRINTLEATRGRNDEALDIQIGYILGVGFDEFPAGFDFFAHQDSENLVSGDGIGHFYLQQYAVFRV